MPNSRTKKNLVIGTFVLLSIAGLTIQRTERIPQNARIFVFRERKRWIPDNKAYSDFWVYEFKDAAKKYRKTSFDRAIARHEKRIAQNAEPPDEQWPKVTKYKEVCTNGEFENFEPLINDENQEFLMGWRGPVLFSWFPHKHRWNAYGEWSW